MSDRDIYSVDGSKLDYDTIITPYDYSLSMGIRKIQRFGYEDRTTFKDGTESSFSDAASVGRNSFEYLFHSPLKDHIQKNLYPTNHFLNFLQFL